MHVFEESDSGICVPMNQPNKDGPLSTEAEEGRPLNRTSVGELHAAEGFGRLLRGPAPAESTSPATPGRDTRLPRAQVIDFGAWPARLDTARAGLLLVLPDLVSLDLPALVRQAGYPGTRVIPAISWLLPTAYSSSFSRVSAMSRLRMVSCPMRSVGPNAAPSVRSMESRSGR